MTRTPFVLALLITSLGVPAFAQQTESIAEAAARAAAAREKAGQPWPTLKTDWNSNAATQDDTGKSTATSPANAAVPLVLDQANYEWQPGSGSDVAGVYSVTLNLRNRGMKSIKLVEAAVNFTDLLGTRLYGVRISPDLNLPALGTAQDKGRYHINQFIAHELRMKDMKKADVIPTLIVNRIVFNDNSQYP